MKSFGNLFYTFGTRLKDKQVTDCAKKCSICV